jgi:hypothetical protein
VNANCKSKEDGICRLPKDSCFQCITCENKEAIEFAIWYSGMAKEKIINAFNRWKKETRITKP